MKKPPKTKRRLLDKNGKRRDHYKTGAKFPRRPNADIWLLGIVGCARCGGNHARLKAHAFLRPPAPAKTTTHWAKCPVTGDPILAWTKTVD